METCGSRQKTCNIARFYPVSPRNHGDIPWQENFAPANFRSVKRVFTVSKGVFSYRTEIY